MLFKYFSKLFLNGYKCHSRSFKLSSTSALSFQYRVSSFNKSAVTAESHLKNSYDGELERRSYISLMYSYIIKNQDKYGAVKSTDIDLTEETNFKSLELLKNLVNNSKNMDSVEKLEDDKISEDLIMYIKSEASNYSLKEVLMFIILTSKLNFNTKTVLLQSFSNGFQERKLTPAEHLKILFLSRNLLSGFFYTKYFIYSFKMVNKLVKKMKHLTPEEIVLLFYILKKIPPEISKNFKYDLQVHLLEKMSKFNIDELAILSNGLLESHINFSNRDLICVLGQKFLEEIESPHELPIFGIFKIISANVHVLNYTWIADFHEKVLPHAEKFKEFEIIHLARTGVNLGYINSSLWEILSHNFKKNFHTYNLKETELMVNVTICCNIKDEELLKMSIEKFESADIQSSSNKYLIFFLYDLIHHQIYPEKLFSLVLSENFRSENKPASFALKEKYKYCFINSFMESHRPGSNFEFMNSKEKQKLYNIFDITSEIFKPLHNRNLNRMTATLKKIYGEDFVCVGKFQPHFKKGMVMRFDKHLTAQPIPEEFKLSERDYCKPLNDDLIWVFIMIFNFSNYVGSTEILNFEAQTEVQQAEACGYVPVLVNSNMWIRSTKIKNEEDFLKNLLHKKLQDIIEKSNS